jgi:hypothetical protein
MVSSKKVEVTDGPINEKAPTVAGGALVKIAVKSIRTRTIATARHCGS